MRLLPTLLICLLVAVPASAATSPSADSIREAARAVLADDSFQRELPKKKSEEEKEPEDDEDDWPDYTGRIWFGDLGPIGSTVLWVLVAAGAALILFYAMSEMSRRFGRAPREEETGEDPKWRVEAPAQTGDPGSLEMADRLARQGDFAAAIHLLLMRSFEDLRRHIDGAIAASLTSREIVSRVPLDEDRRGALSIMVSAAELCHFGGRPPTESDYQTCRASFIRFAPAAPAEGTTG